jgi:CubicO group peptidase (beta-lactamase class C family)
MLLEDDTIPTASGWGAQLSEVLSAAAGTAYENVTLRQLLGMQSGLASNPPNWFVYQQQDPQGTRQSHRAAATTTALPSTPQSVPGSTYLYSNWGYTVAGHILEAHSGMLWEDLLRVRLFQPLGIWLDSDPTTFAGAPRDDASPFGHSGDAQTPCDPDTNGIQCDNPAALGPAGTFSGPVAAMAAYLAWHVRCHNGDHVPGLLLPAQCRTLHTPANASISEYGFGWSCYQRSWRGATNWRAFTPEPTHMIITTPG